MKYVRFIILLTLISCKKDPVTLSSTVFVNSTSHNIKVNTYKFGDVQTGNSFFLAPNETKTVFDLNNRGIGSGLSYGEFNNIADSIEVVFDDIYKIVHYKSTLVGNNTHSYLYDSFRNIYNNSSYTIDMLKDVKYRREWEFRYTFTEQDFVDAQ